MHVMDDDERRAIFDRARDAIGHRELRAARRETGESAGERTLRAESVVEIVHEDAPEGAGHASATGAGCRGSNP